MPFSQAPAGARRILGRWRWLGWLWCCGRSCWWSSRRMTKQSCSVGSGQGRRRARERERYKVVTRLDIFGLVGWRRVLLPHPGSATGHLISQGITTLFSTSRYTFKPTLMMWGSMMWPSLETTPKAITVAGNFFITLGTLSHPDLHFEGAGNGPVVITWIGREHELYSGASPISLIEHCVTFRHDRRLLLLLGFVHNWPTSRWSATKKENWFSLNGNGIMLSFLGRQFYHSTLYISSQHRSWSFLLLSPVNLYFSFNHGSTSFT